MNKIWLSWFIYIRKYINEVYGVEAWEEIMTVCGDPLADIHFTKLRGEEELAQTRECLWWCYDLKRFGNEMKDENWDFIGRLLGADTDHNDNAWKGEEE
jgi:hypothetical protein